MIFDYLKNDKFASYFEIDDNEIITLLNNEILNNQLKQLMDPSKVDMITYIKNAHFSFCAIDTKLNNEMLSLTDNYNSRDFVHITIDGKKINDNIYYNSCHNLTDLYYRIKKYNKDLYFDFFIRVELKRYTKEDVDEYNKHYANFNGHKPKEGEQYLKETNVIINLRTGEEVNIKLPRWDSGYIVYKKYYKPSNKYELYSLETSDKILEYGYNSPIETEKHVIFPSSDNYAYSSKGKAILLNKETGNISYID